MCGPQGPMIAMMVISAASVGIQQYQSNKARDAAQDAADKQEKLAKEAEANQLAALEEQIEQESDATALNKLERERQALRERAKIRVAASESGAFGQSTLKELSASMVGEGYDKGIMDYNLRGKKDQAARQAEGIRISTRSGIANAQATVGPSTPAWMQGLNIGLAAGNSYFQGGGTLPGGGSGSGSYTPHRSDGLH